MRAIYFVFLFVLFSHASMLPGFALGFGYPPISMAESKKRKIFIRAVKVEPRQFNWEGHTVDVDECWLVQDPDKQIVLFKLKIDGKAARERFVEKREGKHLRFTKADHQNPPALAYNRSRGLTGQQRIHYFDLSSPPPATMTLLIDTVVIKNYRAINTRSDVELKFFLAE
jgi:hypothetical protein